MLALEPFWMSIATIRPNNIRIEAKLIIPLREGKGNDKGK